MAILIKSGKLTAVDNITYSTDFAIYKLYKLGNAPIIFPLSPTKVEENENYLVVLKVDLNTGEGKVLSLAKLERGSANILSGVIRVRELGGKLFAGKFEVIASEKPKKGGYLLGSARFKGKRIEFIADKEGDAVLILEG